MSHIYDNWERLVATTLRKQQDLELCFLSDASSYSDSPVYDEMHAWSSPNPGAGKVPRTADTFVMFEKILRLEDNSQENIDISELNLQNKYTIQQGLFGESELVKCRGTWVVKTVISRHISHPEKMVLSAKENTLLRELRHPKILQILGSIVQGEEMILITEYLPKENMDKILAKKIRLDRSTCLRYALDIARGMNYLHQHKPEPIVHNNLNLGNLLLDEGDQVKIGEYWVHMLYERTHPNQEKCKLSDTSQNCDSSCDTKKDIRDFGIILYQMFEGKHITNVDSDYIHLKSVEFEKKFHASRTPGRILQLIEKCTSKDITQRPSFANVIEVLEEVIMLVKKRQCFDFLFSEI